VKIKQKPADFKVTELLGDDIIVERGPHRVYLVSKRQQTSLEAAHKLAELAGVSAADVCLAGLKDKQGVTRQYMSIPKGKPVDYKGEEFKVETVGAAERELSSGDSQGNAFEIVVRDLDDVELSRARKALESVRAHGLPNYFDEQRFGNLKHKQGWIARDLMMDQAEAALKRLLTSISDFEGKRDRAFKSAVFRNWGDWNSCRDIAGKFGQHHSIFQHLKRDPDDFKGAFRYVSSRIRLIHLYALQSHVWNRVLAGTIEREVDPTKHFTHRMLEGKLLFPMYEAGLPSSWNGTLMLPGQGLEGVTDAHQRAAYTSILKDGGLSPEQFRIDGVSGFALKAEPRAAVVFPRDLRLRPAESDPLHRGRKLVRLAFSLPRGSYATLVVRRLIGPAHIRPL
jgi:tRNA pseudouridine13 synthase